MRFCVLCGERAAQCSVQRHNCDCHSFFFLAAVYLWTIGLVKLLAPDAISLMAAKAFHVWTANWLDLTWCYWFGAGLGARWMGIVSFAQLGAMGRDGGRWCFGVASLVPKISAAELGVPVFWYGLQIALRAAAAWYLAQAPAVIEAFTEKLNKPRSQHGLSRKIRGRLTSP